MDPTTWWHLSRASGIVAWFGLAAATMLGILLATKLLGAHKRPAWLLDLHRFVGGLALTFTGLHLVALVADREVDFGPSELLIPFASSWRPLAVAFGVVSFWILAAVQVSSLMMRHVPRIWWKRIHRSSYVLFWTSTIHGAAAGTDATVPLYRGAVVAIVVMIIAATTYRVLTRRAPKTRTA